MLSLGLSRSSGSPLIAHTSSLTSAAPVAPHEDKNGENGELDLVNGFNSLGLQESFKAEEQTQQHEYYPENAFYGMQNNKTQPYSNGRIHESVEGAKEQENVKFGHEGNTQLDPSVYRVIDGLFREEPTAAHNRSYFQPSSRPMALSRVDSAPSLMREYCDDHIHDHVPGLSNNHKSGAPMARSHSQNLNANGFDGPARHRFDGPKARPHLSGSSVTGHSWSNHFHPNGVNLNLDLKGDEKVIFEDDYASIKMAKKGESVVLSVSLLAAGELRFFPPISTPKHIRFTCLAYARRTPDFSSFSFSSSGFVIGANGLCIRKISQRSGADVQSCTIKSDPPMRVFTVSGVANSIQIAVAIIIHAVKIYNDLETRWRGGECVSLEHKVFGIEFLYHPPPPITLGANQKSSAPA